MLKNNNGGDGTNNKDSGQLIKLIKDTGFEQFYELGAKEQIVCQQPVIVGTVASDGASATVAFPSDPTFFTKLYFANCTGRKLISGQKVYLNHKFDNPSQGWLTVNEASIQYGTITTSYSLMTPAGTAVTQKGNQISLNFGINNSAGWGLSQWVSVGSIADVSLPSTNVYIPVLMTDLASSFYNGGSSIGTLMIDSSGNLSVWTYWIDTTKTIKGIWVNGFYSV